MSTVAARAPTGERTTLGRSNLGAVAFWLTVAVAATLPFEFTKQWFPVSWLEVSRVLMVAAVLATVADAIRNRHWPVSGSLPAASVLFVLTAAVSAVIHPATADIKDLASSLAYLAFAFTVAVNVRDLRGLEIIAAAVVAAALVVALVAVLEQLFTFYLWRGDIISQDRRNSTLGDPNIAGRILAVGLAVLLGLVAAPMTITRRNLGIAVAVAVALGVGEALSQSRVVWVLTAFLLLAWVPIVVWRRRTVWPLAAFGAAMLAAILILPFLASRAATINPDDLIAAYGEALSPAAAMALGPPTPADPLISILPIDGIRRYLIRAGVAMWLDHPLTGVGLGGFDEAILGPYRDYIPPDRQGSPTSLLHTDAVRVLAETGVVGFAGWLTFIVAFALAGIRLIRRPGWPKAVAMAILSAFGIILLASQLAGRFVTEPYLWLLVGALMAATRIEKSARAEYPPRVPAEATTSRGA